MWATNLRNIERRKNNQYAFFFFKNIRGFRAPSTKSFHFTNMQLRESLPDLSPDIITKQGAIEPSTSNPFCYNLLFLTIYLDILFNSRRMSIWLITCHFIFFHNTHGVAELSRPRHLVKILYILSSLMAPGATEVMFHILELMTFYWLILVSYSWSMTWFIKICSPHFKKN